MKEKPSEKFIDPEVDQLIEQYHKKPTKEVRDRLNYILIEQREKLRGKDTIAERKNNSTERKL